jgi:hypothetical protein
MILDINQMIRLIVWHLVMGAALYYFTPVASFAYFVGTTIIGAIQNYRAWENIAANNQMIEMYRDKVPQLDDYMNKIDKALEETYESGENNNL